MKRLTCAIIEDDPISLSVIEGLAQKTELLEVKATFNTPTAAILWLANNSVEMLIMDIEMPGMTGLEMFKSLSDKPEVIVVSAKTDYAVQAFDLAITDYLVKPVKDYSRFVAAINKVLAKRKPSVPQTKNTDEDLFVKVDSLLLKLDLESILWIEAFGDYIKIITLEKSYTVYATLKKVEERLDPAKFIRVHRSYIVNIGRITNIDPNNLEINKKIIPISGTYREELLNKITIL